MALWRWGSWLQRLNFLGYGIGSPENVTVLLTQYIQAAMRRAHYELMENGRFFGSIPVCAGAWAEGDTLESCRDELQSVLEDWILIKARFGDVFPVTNGAGIFGKLMCLAFDG